MAIQRLQNAENSFFPDTFGKDAPEEPPLSYFMVSSMQPCFETKHLMEDLKVRIVENHTNIDFITSDDPAIMTNKFHSQRKRIDDGFGVRSSGMMLFMPLTPRHALLSYDRPVYTVANTVGGRVHLKKTDVESLNELHFLKASSGLFFFVMGYARLCACAI